MTILFVIRLTELFNLLSSARVPKNNTFTASLECSYLNTIQPGIIFDNGIFWLCSIIFKIEHDMWMTVKYIHTTGTNISSICHS
ncbi:hypothetical protein [Bacteroides acidifaciens]|uniref:hypothetical protein n=1 Tax=Bacteroides acidifaciens TaxID=85831 RepID=UPI0026E9CCDF|nr:hypothetical protein [Bacteroides acidifaciens]